MHPWIWYFKQSKEHRKIISLGPFLRLRQFPHWVSDDASGPACEKLLRWFLTAFRILARPSTRVVCLIQRWAKWFLENANKARNRCTNYRQRHFAEGCRDDHEKHWVCWYTKSNRAWPDQVLEEALHQRSYDSKLTLAQAFLLSSKRKHCGINFNSISWLERRSRKTPKHISVPRWLRKDWGKIGWIHGAIQRLQHPYQYTLWCTIERKAKTNWFRFAQTISKVRPLLEDLP